MTHIFALAPPSTEITHVPGYGQFLKGSYPFWAEAVFALSDRYLLSTSIGGQTIKHVLALSILESRWGVR